MTPGPDRRALRVTRPIRPRRARAGFTLIELLLVVFIVGLASAIAVPRFMGSFQGAQLRSAARTVAMASRYARSTAVLQQKDMAIIFYPARNELEMVSIGNEAGAADRERFLDSRNQRAMAGLLEDDDAPVEENAALPPIQSEMVRALPDTVKIVNVEVDDEVIVVEDSYVVNYFSNGMSDSFALNLVDDGERTARILVDPLSGKVTIEYGN
jgi:prepilin-type N-terminal cleavage/methylation domain-containing protein